MSSMLLRLVLDLIRLLAPLLSPPSFLNSVLLLPISQALLRTALDLEVNVQLILETLLLLSVTQLPLSLKLLRIGLLINRRLSKTSSLELKTS